MDSSSQMSKLGYNDNLSTKAKIEDIRASILRNVKKFYTLKWIKLIFLIIFAISLVFTIIFFSLYVKMNNDLKSTSNLNMQLNINSLELSKLISALISIASLKKLVLRNESDLFNSYLANKTEYYTTLKYVVINGIIGIENEFDTIVSYISDYYPDSKLNNTNTASIWDTIYLNLPTNNPDYKESNHSFINGYSQILMHANSIIKNPFFNNYNNMNYTPGFIATTVYSYNIMIANSLRDVLPELLKLINVVPEVFKVYNDNSLANIAVLISVFFGVMILLIAAFSVFVSLTNNNMQRCLSFLTRIGIEDIKSVFEKIENFNNNTLKPFKLNNRFDEISSKLLIINKDIKEKKQKDKKVSRVNSSQNHTNLSALKNSYYNIMLLILIPCITIIPTYFVLQQNTENTTTMIQIESFLFSKLFFMHYNLLKTLCTINTCSDTPPDIFYKITEQEELKIIRELTMFNRLYDFYNNKYLVDPCMIIADKPPSPIVIDYDVCIVDKVIIKANNTVSLSRMINDNLNKLIIYKDLQSQSSYYVNNTLFTDTLFGTEEFKETEYIFYKFIQYYHNKIRIIINTSFDEFLLNNQTLVVIYMMGFLIMIMFLTIYISFRYTKNLINLLSVSRFIYMIVPTSVISNTEELLTWIEKNNFIGA